MESSDCLTLVTAYYELNRFEKRPMDRNRKNYYNWAELVIGLDKNIVFYVGEEQDYFYIWKKRRKLGYLDKTEIIFKKFEELPLFNLRNDIKEYIDETPPINISEKETNYFAIMTWSKIFLMDDAIKKNIFDTKYFGWIDFGIYHVAKGNIPDDLEYLLIPKTDKIKILERVWTTESEMEDHVEYAKMLRCKMGGGLWLAEISYMQEFIKLFKKYLFYLLSNKLVIQEEGIFGMIYHYHKELFETYLGNYYNILENLEELRSYDYIIMFNIVYCVENKSYEHAYNTCLTLFENLTGHMELDEIFDLYDNFTKAAYTINKKKGLEKVYEWYDFILDNIENLYDIFVNERERILKNISKYKDEQIQKKFREICTKPNKNCLF